MAKRIKTKEDEIYYCYDCHQNKGQFMQGDPEKRKCANCGDLCYCISKVHKFNRYTYDELDKRTLKEKRARGIRTVSVVHRTNGDILLMCECKPKSKWHYENSRIYNATTKLINIMETDGYENNFVSGVKDYMKSFHRVSIFQYKAIKGCYKSMKFHRSCCHFWDVHQDYDYGPEIY